MKPLVYYCRWHEARLRLRGREPDRVWGELAYADGSERFSYHLQTAQLTLEGRSAAEPRRRLQLDEMGVVTETLSQDD